MIRAWQREGILQAASDGATEAAIAKTFGIGRATVYRVLENHNLFKPSEDNGAIFSDCKSYRYALWRIWDHSKQTVLFLGLNPSTADATNDDPTSLRCIDFAKSWGFGGIYLANLFSYCATEPVDMKSSTDPIGKENDAWLKKLSNASNLIVAAWGNDGIFLGRNVQVKGLLPNMQCLKINKSGEPAHPLYQKADLTPIPLKY